MGGRHSKITHKKLHPDPISCKTQDNKPEPIKHDNKYDRIIKYVLILQHKSKITDIDQNFWLRSINKLQEERVITDDIADELVKFDINYIKTILDDII